MIKVIPPSRTVSSDMTMQFGNTSIQLLQTPGHTEDLMTVYLPKEKILFASDSIYPTKNTPVLFMGDPDNWVKSLERLLSLEIKVLLPGHGLIPKDPHAEIKQHIEKLTDIKNRTIAAIRKSDKPIAFSELEKHADFLKGRDLQGVVRALVKRGIIEADSEDITRANLRLKS